MTKAKKDERVTKRRVTMVNSLAVEEGGKVVTKLITATDFVRPDFLEAYVADARSRWSAVTVSDEPDAGPAGFDGPTYIPAGLDHPDAGSYFPASDCTNCTHAPEGARVIRAEG